MSEQIGKGINKMAINTDTHWTANELLALLHICTGTPGWDETNPQVAEGRGTLLADQDSLYAKGLIAPDPAHPKYYAITSRGDVLVEMLKKTPPPTQRWVDPREV